MSHPPGKSSALRKFERGAEQLKRLCSEVEAFERADVYTFRTEVESRTANSVTYRCVATQRQPPSDEWPLLAGEAIQNLHASLDHVIYARAEPPSDQNLFPICTNPDKFNTAAKRRLRGVPESVKVTWRRSGTNRPLGAGDTHVSTFVAAPSPESRVSS